MMEALCMNFGTGPPHSPSLSVGERQRVRRYEAILGFALVSLLSLIGEPYFLIRT
jgi:hypothetical protein